MQLSMVRNIGSYLNVLAGFASTTFTAGSGNDNVAQNGLTIDRFSQEHLSLSGLFSLHGLASLAEDETAAVTITFEDSADGSNWDAYDPGPVSPAYAALTVSADGHFVATRKIQLGGARRYVRPVVTINLSASGTDTVVADGVLVLGPPQELPNAAAVAEGSSS